MGKISPDSATVGALWRIKADQGKVNKKKKLLWIPMNTIVTLCTKLDQKNILEASGRTLDQHQTRVQGKHRPTWASHMVMDHPQPCT